MPPSGKRSRLEASRPIRRVRRWSNQRLGANGVFGKAKSSAAGGGNRPGCEARRERSRHHTWRNRDIPFGRPFSSRAIALSASADASPAKAADCCRPAIADKIA